MFWFGMFEYYDTSLCLLAFQIGQFDADTCSCASRDAAHAHRGSSGLVPVSMSSNRSRVDMLSVTEVAELEEMVLLDNALYEYTMREFMRRVSRAEHILNLTIFCHPTRKRQEFEQIRKSSPDIHIKK